MVVLWSQRPITRSLFTAWVRCTFTKVTREPQRDKDRGSLYLSLFLEENDKAIPLFEKVLVAYPDNVDVLKILGSLYRYSFSLLFVFSSLMFLCSRLPAGETDRRKKALQYLKRVCDGTKDAGQRSSLVVRFPSSHSSLFQRLSWNSVNCKSKPIYLPLSKRTRTLLFPCTHTHLWCL
jgi:hypothetical protein